jgi:predicted RNA binding protein with dsRBD fold (UPF0201 family)
MKLLSTCLLLAVVFASCSLLPGHKSKKSAVARFNGQYLYKDELAGIVPKGSSVNDSTEMIHNYINNWVRTQLLVNQAENNLAEELKDFEKEVQQYRNSLIIYKYESELVRQKMDTAVTPQEIESYYRDNSANFLLHENIVRAEYVSVSKSSPNLSKIRMLLQSNKPEDKGLLEQLVHNLKTDFLLGNKDWIPFVELARKVPLNTQDQEYFLNKNKFYEIKDSLNHYLVKIYDYKTKESISPLSFETENIRKIILNKRKFEFLSRMEEDLFKGAVKKKKFEIY